DEGGEVEPPSILLRRVGDPLQRGVALLQRRAQSKDRQSLMVACQAREVGAPKFVFSILYLLSKFGDLPVVVRTLQRKHDIRIVGVRCGPSARSGGMPVPGGSLVESG